MPAKNTDSPKETARLFREDAIRVAEENYKLALAKAARARDAALSAASQASTDAADQARKIIAAHKLRLSESRDRIEAKLRKQELEEARRNQERLVIEADNSRIKTVKQAHDTYKQSVNQASDARKKAILKAHDDEKSIRKEAEFRLKAAKKTTIVESPAVESLREEENTPEIPKSETITIATEPVFSPEPVVSVPVTEPGGENAPQQAVADTAPAPRVYGKAAAILSGTVKLVVSQASISPSALAAFEKDLRAMSGIRLVMSGGSAREGYQFIVNVITPAALAEMLRQMPSVEQAEDAAGNISVTLRVKTVS